MNEKPTDPKATEKDAIAQALDPSPTIDNPVKDVSRETGDAVAPDHDAPQDAPTESDGQG
jgi:hypothetical protein